MHEQFIINIIINIICFITCLNLSLFIISLYQQINSKTISLYLYKINNFTLNIMIIISYSLIFIIFFYILRIYNLEKVLDLKLFFFNVNTIWTMFVAPLAFTVKLLLLTLFLYFLLLILFLLLLITKRAMLEIFKLYIFIILSPKKSDFKNWRYKLITIFADFHHDDIVTYIIKKIKYYIIYYCFFIKQNDNWSSFYLKIPYYFKIMDIIFQSKYYRLFLQSSPLLIIIYDCVFNNWVITHVYSYLLFYIPIMLLKKITTATSKTNNSFAEILWDLYYNKNHGILFIASKEQKELINIFLKANVGYIQEFALSMVEYHLQKSLQYKLVDDQKNIYVNFDSNYLKIENNKIFQVLEDDDGNEIYVETDDWFLI